jgi:hypothetical protein
MLASFLSQHAVGDIGLYLCFLLGQFLFILKRSASAIRNPANPIKTRRDFVYRNWDVLSVRAAIEGLGIFYPYRHFGIVGILGWFHIVAPQWVSFLFGSGEASGAVVTIAVGYAADSALDAFSQWSKLPAWVAKWMKENIPQAPIASGSALIGGGTK